MGEVPLACLFRFSPLIANHLLQTPHRFIFRDTSISHAVQVSFEQLLFLLRSEVPILGQVQIVVVSHEVEYIFFEVGAGTTNNVHFVLPNHLAREMPSSAVLIAPARVTIIFPPLSR